MCIRDRDGFAQTHVVRQNAAEAVRGQIGQEVEAGHLVRAQGGLKLGGNVRLDIDLDFRGAVLDACLLYTSSSCQHGVLKSRLRPGRSVIPEQTYTPLFLLSN